MARKYAIRNDDEFYFVTFTVVYWLDVFIREEYRNIFMDSLGFCQKNKGLEVGAYCIMTSHVHLILRAPEGGSLSNIIRDLKSYTARHIRKYMESNPQESRKEWMLWMMERAGKKNSNNNGFQFWQQHNHPIELSTIEILKQRLNYVHENPVKAGFVSRAADWNWSSARDYGCWFMTSTGMPSAQNARSSKTMKKS